MARRKKESGIEVLLSAPWWLSAGLGVLAWIALSAVIPSAFASNPILAGLAALSKSVSWLPLPIFGLIAIASYFKSRKATVAPPPTAFQRKPSFKSKEPIQRATDIRPEKDMYRETTRPTAQASASAPVPDWSIESLRSLEWKRFELLCAKYYEAVGFKTATLAAGPDGGIDIKLYRVDPNAPTAIVQCKAWMAQVRVNEVRELFGVMHHEKVDRGIFITSGTYTKDALAFGAANPMQLLDGEALLKRILDLQPDARNALKEFAFDGDYTTPTCASCGVKMIQKESAKKAFWGCSNFPRCRKTLNVKATR